PARGRGAARLRRAVGPGGRDRGGLRGDLAPRRRGVVDPLCLRELREPRRDAPGARQGDERLPRGDVGHLPGWRRKGGDARAGGARAGRLAVVEGSPARAPPRRPPAPPPPAAPPGAPSPAAEAREAPQAPPANAEVLAVLQEIRGVIGGMAERVSRLENRR